MTTDTTEKGLESLIVRAMTGRTELISPPHQAVDTAVPVAGGTGWLLGDPRHYDREYAVDIVQLRGFLRMTQEPLVEALDLDHDSPTRRKFLARLQGEITKRGVIDVLRHGVKHGPVLLDLFYGTPSPGNPAAAERYAAEPLHRHPPTALQPRRDAARARPGPVHQRPAGRHLRAQEQPDQADGRRMPWSSTSATATRARSFSSSAAAWCTSPWTTRRCASARISRARSSWFLPFNQGWNDGAGNPPNPDGLKTDYLWKRILTPRGLDRHPGELRPGRRDQGREDRQEESRADLPALPPARRGAQAAGRRRPHGAGKRYLIQHSAGSGKSNSIAWLAHQLIGLRKDDAAVFDSIIVVTDRRILDQQIRDTIKQFAQVGATVGHAEHSGDLRRFIESGKKIIITTVQKFPLILDDIGNEQRGRRFAIVIDEAHSSQGGKSSAALSTALSVAGAEEDDETTEDKINRIMEARKLLPNASYFAFTATPKNKTLEIFGEPLTRRAGRSSTGRSTATRMKQAIQEGFILDVLKQYTPVESYYKLIKKVEGDPEFDTKRAQKKLRRYVESHDHAIRLKAEIMVDHFHEQVLGAQQDRRPGAGDGRDQRHRARHPVLPTPSATTSWSARARTAPSSPSRASTSRRPR